MIQAPLNVLMGALIPRLKADAALQGLIGQRVFDAVPLDAPYPFVSLGDAWEQQDDAECVPALSIGFRLDVWSRTVGAPEARSIAHRVRNVLHEIEIDLSEGALAMIEHQRTDVIRDQDGLTSHAIVEFSAVIET